MAKSESTLAREQRLAAKLKENLRRRKAQARARGAAADAEGGGGREDGPEHGGAPKNDGDGGGSGAI